MTIVNNIPEASYGILLQNQHESTFDEAVEQVKNIGYAVINSGYNLPTLQSIADKFNHTRESYIKTHSETYLKALNEFHAIRSPLTHGDEAFLRLALNDNLLSILKKLMHGKFILNQQNGIINPPQDTYNQAAWHRDLPYQHFITTRPLAINALFCIDDFTVENGATFVLPASHKSEAFPSSQYIQQNAIQVEAKAGSFILLDCMVFHAGGYNTTRSERRAVNHVYNIPYFKQQINIPINMRNASLTAEEKDILGFNYMEPTSVMDYFITRTKEKY